MPTSRLLGGLVAVLAVLVIDVAAGSGTADAAPPTCFGRRATIVGTTGPDVLVGTGRADVIVGLAGADTITEGGGADRICAGPSSPAPERVDGGSGNDLISGGSGPDVLRGDSGADRIHGGGGHDDLDGGTGKDVNHGGEGRDVCRSPYVAAILCEPYCRPNQRYVGLRIGERRVNSVEAQQSTPSCFAESDFMLTRDGQLVATHDAAMGGNCGNVTHAQLEWLRRCRLADGARVATLASFLRVPLTEWYIDLKSNQFATSDAEILRSVSAAVGAVVKTGRIHGAVLLLYQITPEALNVIRANGVRAGMKGYPVSREAAESLILQAQANAFEAVCIQTTHVDPPMLDFSRERGIWHLGWDLGENTPERWRELADAGLTGLLTTRRRIPAIQRAIRGH